MKKFEIDPTINPERNFLRAYVNVEPYLAKTLWNEEWRLKDGVSSDKQYLLDEFLFWEKKAMEERVKFEERSMYSL